MLPHLLAVTLMLPTTGTVEQAQKDSRGRKARQFLEDVRELQRMAHDMNANHDARVQKHNEQSARIKEYLERIRREKESQPKPDKPN